MQERPTLIDSPDGSGRSVELETVLPQIVSLVMTVTMADACLIYLLDETRNLLILRASSEPRHAMKARVLMKVGELPSCRRNPVAGSPLKVLPEVHEDDACASLSIPLLTPFRRFIGVLNVRYDLSVRSHRGRWQLLPALAQKVANAIENVDLCTSTPKYELGIAQVSETLQDFSADDSLTGLSNFRFFHEALEREILRAVRYRQPLGLVLYDVDQFHEVNDTYGLSCGDQALQAIAARLLENCYYSDIAFRYGGDEFGMLLPGTDAKGARERAEGFQADLEAMGIHIGSNMRIRVAVSAGIAVFDPEHPIDKAAFIKLADTALYESKCAHRKSRKVAKPRTGTTASRRGSKPSQLRQLVLV